MLKCAIRKYIEAEQRAQLRETSSSAWLPAGRPAIGWNRVQALI
jgi:hypothetical protein